MKLTIEYSLPDEEEEMKLMMNAGKYLIALSNMKAKLRTMNKYGFGDEIKTPDEMLEHVTNFFYEAIDGLDL